MVNSKSKLYLVLFGFFFVTCWSFGYSILGRYAPNLLYGLSDTAIYYSIVENGLNSIEYDINNRSNRILVPLIARIFYLALPSVGTWDPAGHALLITNSFFTSLAALMIFDLSFKMFNILHLSLISSFIYISNFIVVNWFLIGGVDSAWSLSCIALIYLLHSERFYLLPFLSIFATLTKEHYLLFGSLIILLWITYELIYENKLKWKNIFYFLLSTLISLTIIIVIQSILQNQLTMPWQIINDISVLEEQSFDLNFIFSIVSRFIIVSGLLLVLSFQNIRMFNKKILFVIGLTIIIQFIFGFIIGLSGYGYGRSLFNIASYVLCTSAAMTLYKLLDNLK